MEALLINPGDQLIFKPARNTCGWTVERSRSLSFKHTDRSPQEFLNKRVHVIDYCIVEESFRVHFTEDTPSDYFYCCATMLEPVTTCICASIDLFNFGCRCGASKAC